MARRASLWKSPGAVLGWLRLFVTRRSVAQAQQGGPDRGRGRQDRGIPQPRRGEDMPRKPVDADRRPARRPGRDRSGGGRTSGAGAMARGDPRRAAFGARPARRIPEGGAGRPSSVPALGSAPCPRPSPVRAETRAPARPCPARVEAAPEETAERGRPPGRRGREGGGAGLGEAKPTRARSDAAPAAARWPRPCSGGGWFCALQSFVSRPSPRRRGVARRPPWPRAGRGPRRRGRGRSRRPRRAGRGWRSGRPRPG